MRDRVRGLTTFPSGAAVAGADDVQDQPTGAPEAESIDPTGESAEEAQVAPAEPGARSRGNRMRPIDAVAVMAAVLVALVVVIIIAKGEKKQPHVGTAAPTAGSTPTWVYKDLHGDPVIVSAGSTGSARFTTLADGSKVPLAVADVQADSQNHDCAALKASYDNWVVPADKGASSNYQERASAYARYSLDTAKADHCAWVATVS